jgi:transposase InsO family protein
MAPSLFWLSGTRARVGEKVLSRDNLRFGEVLGRHNSDRGVQYLSIRYTERLVEAGIESSVGSVGDSYDNALAETINGLFKAEVIHRRGPRRSADLDGRQPRPRPRPGLEGH